MMMKKAGAAMRQTIGETTIMPPTPAATPRPPWKPRKTDFQAPSTAATPVSAWTSMGAPSARAMRMGTAPLARSSRPTVMARPQPMARRALVPPVRPEPTVRGSVPPVRRATMTPMGSEPMR